MFTLVHMRQKLKFSWVMEMKKSGNLFWQFMIVIGLVIFQQGFVWGATPAQSIYQQLNKQYRNVFNADNMIAANDFNPGLGKYVDVDCSSLGVKVYFPPGASSLTIQTRILGLVGSCGSLDPVTNKWIVDPFEIEIYSDSACSGSNVAYAGGVSTHLFSSNFSRYTIYSTNSDATQGSWVILRFSKCSQATNCPTSVEISHSYENVDLAKFKAWSDNDANFQANGDPTTSCSSSTPVSYPLTIDPKVTSSNDLTVQFNPEVQNAVGSVSYEWDFGDGNTSTESEPTHIYATAGTYSVTLTVWDSSESVNNITNPLSVTVPKSTSPVGGTVTLKANNSVDLVSGEAPLSVNFEVQMDTTAQQTVTEYRWSFSNIPTISTTTLPQKEYFFQNPGLYTVSVSAYGSNGFIGASNEISITVNETDPGPTPTDVQVTLSADKTEGVAPLSVTVTADVVGLSNIEGFQYSWRRSDVGNPITTEINSNTFTFDNAGEYTIGVGVHDPATGWNGDFYYEEEPIQITVTEEDLPSDLVTLSTTDATTGAVPMTVTVTATLSDELTSEDLWYSWKVNGEISKSYQPGESENPNIEKFDFSETGKYEIQLGIAADVNDWKYSNVILVNVTSPVSLSKTPDSANPLKMNFTCSVDGVDSELAKTYFYSWDFDTAHGDEVDDSGTGLMDTSNTYVAGEYTASVTVTDAEGNPVGDASSLVNAKEDGVPSSPEVSLSATPKEGTAPLTVDFTCSVDGVDSELAKTYFYSWDFDIQNGDEVDDSGTGLMDTSNTYVAGEYTASVTVTDAEGNLVGTPANVNINVTSENTTSYDDGYSAGVAFCQANPGACGIDAQEVRFNTDLSFTIPQFVGVDDFKNFSFFYIDGSEFEQVVNLFPENTKDSDLTTICQWIGLEKIISEDQETDYKDGYDKAIEDCKNDPTSFDITDTKLSLSDDFTFTVPRFVNESGENVFPEYRTFVFKILSFGELKNFKTTDIGNGIFLWKQETYQISN